MKMIEEYFVGREEGAVHQPLAAAATLSSLWWWWCCSSGGISNIRCKWIDVLRVSAVAESGCVVYCRNGMLAGVKHITLSLLHQHYIGCGVGMVICYITLCCVMLRYIMTSMCHCLSPYSISPPIFSFLPRCHKILLLTHPWMRQRSTELQDLITSRRWRLRGLRWRAKL